MIRDRKLYQEMSQLLLLSIDQVMGHVIGHPIKIASYHDLREDASALAICSVAFRGDVTGEVTLYLDDKFVNLLVQKVGYVPAPNDQEPPEIDIIGELLNMVVGRTLSQMGEGRINYSLSMPHFWDREDDIKQHMNSFSSYLFTLSCLDHLCMIRLQGESPRVVEKDSS